MGTSKTAKQIEMYQVENYELKLKETNIQNDLPTQGQKKGILYKNVNQQKPCCSIN